jgi:hypothetical protein
MPGLRSLLVSRSPLEVTETNIQTGVVYAYSPGTYYTNFCNMFCWKPPITVGQTGTAIVEIWGAGGSGSRMCCCGGGLPGNAGAYVKKTICVGSTNYVCGAVGFPRYAHDLCFSGCGDNTGVCWTSNSTNGCMCARGGRGGTSFCSTGTSLWCCFYANGFCGYGPASVWGGGENCGIICNHCNGGWEALAYGGDVNCCGRIGCMSFFGCYPNCNCHFMVHAPLPAGMYGVEGSVVTFKPETDDTAASSWSGNQITQYLTALGSLTKAPQTGIPMTSCWRSDRSCGCYEMQGCAAYLPIGAGGLPPMPCPQVRDHGIRGGWGGVRIRFIKD